MWFRALAGFAGSALLAAVALSGPAAAAGSAAETELRPDSSFGGRALDFLTNRRGRITGAWIVEAGPGALALRVSYSGLEGDGLVLTARALDRRRAPLLSIPEGRVELTSGDGETVVRLEQSRAGDLLGQRSMQRYVLVEIGPKAGRNQCRMMYQCEHEWSGGAGGTGGGAGGSGGGGAGSVVKLVAQPVGKSAGLQMQRPLVLFRAVLPDLLKTAPEPAQPGGVVVKEAGFGRFGYYRQFQQLTPVPGQGPKVRPGLIVALPEDVTKYAGKGPSTTALSLSDIASDVNVGPEEIFPFLIYQDANPQSGLYYYLPRGYHLAWDEGTGYAFRVLYGAQAGEANPNTVYVSARLTAGISSADLALAEKLVERAWRKEYPQGKFGGLKGFPISGMKPELNGEAYNIPKDKLVVNGSMDLTGTIDLSFTTDPVTKENIQAVLTQGLGLTGSVLMLSASAADAPRLEARVPLSIRLADRSSFGTRAFTRSAPFRNTSPYPMRLKYLHALMEESPGRVYSYALGDRLVPAAATGQIDASQVREWLDGAALKMWIEYAPAGDETAHKRVMDQVTGGVSNVAQTEIAFRTLAPLADTGAALIVVTLTSRYLDPKAQVEKTVTLELNKDNETFRVKPVFLVNRQLDEDKPGDPLFKYRLTVVKPDGSSKDGQEWIPSSKKTIFIGAAQIKPLLGTN